MPDYKQGKIYRIYSPSKGLVYYGATTATLKHRFSRHKSEHRLNKRTYESYLVIECGDAQIELVENFPCDSKAELDKREGYYQRNNECVNRVISARTPKEYRADNK